MNMEFLLKNEIIVLLAVIFSGCLIGFIRIKGVSLGSTACLFTGLVAGVFGAKVPNIIEQVGILFFVYSIGLSMGPKFFHIFKGKVGLNMILLSIVTIAVGAIISSFGSLLLNLPEGGFIGVFAGALTSTPTLASAIDAVSGGDIYPSRLSIAYTVTYPLGFLLIVLFVQYIPRIFKEKFQQELESEKNKKSKDDFQAHSFILQNKKLFGKSLNEIDLRKICRVNITRIKRGDNIIFVRPDTVFQENDIAVVVGLQDEMLKFENLFGPRHKKGIEPSSDMNVRDIVLANNKLAGVKLNELKIPLLYGVTVTRIRRSGINITPDGNKTLEMGDEIRVFGSEANIKCFIEFAGLERKKLDETNIFTLTLGMFMGLALGYIPFEIGNVTFRLGVAGGPLIVALLFAHFGKIGKWQVRLPIATRIFLREFGLVFFLASIGVTSGNKLIGTMIGLDILLFIVLGAIVALITMISSYYFAVKILHMSIASSLGAICGSMTSTPALGVLIRTIDDESPTIAYASAYPMATILLTISGQILVWISYLFKIIS